MKASRQDLSDTDDLFQSPEQVLFLVDQLIGLQSQLAELRYQCDRDLESLRSEKLQLERWVEELTIRVSSADARVEALLASKSWVLGQKLLGPVHRIRRLAQRGN